MILRICYLGKFYPPAPGGVGPDAFWYRAQVLESPNAGKETGRAGVPRRMASEGTRHEPVHG